MMAERISQNRQMFWRITRRMLSANRGRLFVMLLALGSGAAVTAALLNLQVDAKRRLTSEFRAFGANVIIGPKVGSNSFVPGGAATIPESLLQALPQKDGGQPVPAVAFLYATADVTAFNDQGINHSRLGSGRVVFAGFRAEGNSAGNDVALVIPYRVLNPRHGVILDAETCDVGERVASKFGLRFGAVLQWEFEGKPKECLVSELQSFGSVEDSQVFLPLDRVQEFAGLRNRVSVIQLNVPGTPSQVENYVALLEKRLPDVEVHAVRQITVGEARIYGRISGLLTATVIVVLVLTSLCVMAAMTNIAVERKNDVGLMKAIGGATRRVLRLFLMEAALLGIAGGMSGAAAGILLSMWLGKQVFGVAARPRLIVYPVAVGLTVIVAILSAFPLRRLASIRPAAVFRGEA